MNTQTKLGCYSIHRLFMYLFFSHTDFIVSCDELKRDESRITSEMEREMGIKITKKNNTQRESKISGKYKTNK